MQNISIGYVPYSNTFERPGDKRRFVHYAKQKKLRFEIADPQKKYDLVVLSECADLSVWSRYPHGKVVYDLIDSYLAIPKTNLKGLLRGAAKFASRQSLHLKLNHWQAIADMCRRADAVICSTEEQKQAIEAYCSNVHIILDAHSSVIQTTKQNYAATEPFRLVWEGLPQTLGSFTQIKPALEALRNKYPLELHLVTDPNYYRYLGLYGKTDTLTLARKFFPDIQLHPWNTETCAKILCACDLAVLPLSLDDPFIYGKPENKLFLFWRLGIPTLASATPAYARAMQSAGLNDTCAHADEWLKSLERLILDETARRENGLRGKAFVEREHNEEKLLARWDALFASLGFNTKD